MQVQKILYFANMLFIGRSGHDNPLIEDKFLTWVYGPAVDLLYERIKRYGKDSVKREAFDDIIPIMNEDTQEPEEGYKTHVEVLKDAYKRWGKFDSYKLVGISHWRKGAWKKSVDSEEKEISNILIKEEFDARYSHEG